MNRYPLNEQITVGSAPLLGETPVRVTLVHGSEFAVLVDSATDAMGGAILDLIDESVIGRENVRILVNTHGHHDHIGANRRVKRSCRALLAAPEGAVAWIEDFEEHYRQFCLVSPEILADQQWMREECLSALGEEERVDIVFAEGANIRLGGGVELETVSLPGHMKAEIGFIEHSTNTLIVGDAVISNGIVDVGPLFHGYQDASAYLATLDKLEVLLAEHRFDQVVSGHLPLTDWEGFSEFVATAKRFFDKIELDLIEIVAARPRSSTGDVWHALCNRWGYREEFRGLAMVQAHLEHLISARVIARSVEGSLSLP